MDASSTATALVSSGAMVDDVSGVSVVLLQLIKVALRLLLTGAELARDARGGLGSFGAGTTIPAWQQVVRRGVLRLTSNNVLSFDVSHK